MNLTDGIINIKGIGEKTAKGFNSLGIETISDLMSYYPRAYKTYTEPVSVSNTAEGDRVAVLCRIVS